MTVYFIRSDCGRIKIGYTAAREADKRLAELQSMSPRELTLLATLPDESIGTERKLHEMFSEERQHGEWFTPSQRLLDAIESVREDRPVCVDGVTLQLQKDRPGREATDEAAQAILARYSAAPEPKSPSWDFVYGEWSEVADHTPKEEFVVVEHIEGWQCRHNGELDERKGPLETAKLIARVCHDPQKLAAAWILAFLRHDHGVALADTVSELSTLVNLCSAQLGTRPWWHHTSGRVLPVCTEVQRGDRYAWETFVEKVALTRAFVNWNFQIALRGSHL